MLTLSDLQYLMHQLGPAMPAITTIVQEAIDSWMVEFDEGVSLQLAWEHRSMRVLLKCALGQPDEGAREDIYAALLSANLLLTGVADVKLGLSHVDDDVVLIGEYALEDASIDTLGRHLSDFLVYAGKFSEMIARSCSPASSDELRSVAGLHQDRA